MKKRLNCLWKSYMCFLDELPALGFIVTIAMAFIIGYPVGYAIDPNAPAFITAIGGICTSIVIYFLAVIGYVIIKASRVLFLTLREECTKISATIKKCKCEDN